MIHYITLSFSTRDKPRPSLLFEAILQFLLVGQSPKLFDCQLNSLFHSVVSGLLLGVTHT